MNIEIIWNNFLEKIKERISPLSYDTWFKDTKLYKLDKNTAIIIVPMILHKKHLEENYLDEIEEIFNSITGTNFNFQFKLENEITEDTLEEKIIDETESIGVPHQTSSSANLNSEYTFDSFIVGDLLLLRRERWLKNLVKLIILCFYTERVDLVKRI